MDLGGSEEREICRLGNGQLPGKKRLTVLFALKKSFCLSQRLYLLLT